MLVVDTIPDSVHLVPDFTRVRKSSKKSLTGDETSETTLDLHVSEWVKSHNSEPHDPKSEQSVIVLSSDSSLHVTDEVTDIVGHLRGGSRCSIGVVDQSIIKLLKILKRPKTVGKVIQDKEGWVSLRK